MAAQEMAAHEPTTDLVERAPQIAAPAAVMTDDEIRRSYRVASALAKSGMFKDVGQAERAFAKIVLGRDLGMTPMQSMMSLDIVKGNAMIRGVALAAFVRRHPDYDYRVTEHDATTCSVAFRRRWEGEWEDIGTSTFTIDDAKAAGLVKTDSAWATYPRNMLLWRAISNGVKWYCPDLMGGVPIYVDGEIERETVLGATGDGESSGLDLGPAVEAVLDRAARLGHAGLADRATAEMTLSHQPPDFWEGWVRQANDMLDDFEAERAETPEAEAEEIPDTAGDAQQMRDDAAEIEAAAQCAADEGHADAARELLKEAEELRAAADALDA